MIGGTCCKSGRAKALPGATAVTVMKDSKALQGCCAATTTFAHKLCGSVRSPAIWISSELAFICGGRQLSDWVTF